LIFKSTLTPHNKKIKNELKSPQNICQSNMFLYQIKAHQFSSGILEESAFSEGG